MKNNTVPAEESNKPDGTSNSVETPITVICFSLNRNPTLTELKKTFAAKKGKLFHARKNLVLADVFDNLFAVRASRPSEGRFYDHKSKNFISHFYILDQAEFKKEFAILKYGTQLLGGFDCVASELKEIHDLLEAYRVVTFFCMESRSSFNRLHDQINEIEKSQLMDLSAYSNLLSKSAQELNVVTSPIICLAKAKVDEWYDKHIWKAVDLSPIALQDKSLQSAESNAETNFQKP